MKHKRLSIAKVLNVVVVTTFFAFYLVPFVWVVLSSIKPEFLIVSKVPVLVFPPTLNHFIRLQTEYSFYHIIITTAILSGSTSLLCVALALPAAYALARYNTGGDFLSILILSFRFLPIVVVLLPLFLMYMKLKLIDTYLGMIMAYMLPNLPLSVWLLKGFLRDIPVELDEAAHMDGCNELMTIWHIIVPLAKPALVVTGIFVFLFSWNEFFTPVILARKDVIPVSVAFVGFKQQYQIDWGAMSAATVVCLAPLLIMIIFFQRHIVRGLTLGAIKK